MRIEIICELKDAKHKPVRKNKSEVTITLVAESYNPGDEFRDLYNKSGRTVKVCFTDDPDEDAIDGRRDR